MWAALSHGETEDLLVGLWVVSVDAFFEILQTYVVTYIHPKTLKKRIDASMKQSPGTRDVVQTRICHSSEFYPKVASLTIWT